MEIRRRLEGKAAGQLYKLWVTPKGAQLWTKCLGLAAFGGIKYISCYHQIICLKKMLQLNQFVACIHVSFCFINVGEMVNLRGAAAAEGFKEENFDKLATIQKNLKPGKVVAPNTAPKDDVLGDSAKVKSTTKSEKKVAKAKSKKKVAKAKSKKKD